MGVISATKNASKVAPQYDLLIIGAGVAGLAAGRMAHRAGYSVMLIDKGRRVGGRVSTRRIENFVFNHGAQYITARTTDFTEALRAAVSAGMAANWQIEDDKTVFVGHPVMRAIPNFLAQDLPIQQNRRIAHIIRKSNHILCIDTDGRKITARQVICTAPAPQTALLLARDFPRLSATAASAAYAPCITVMLGLANDSQLPAAPVSAPRHDIGWAMRENSRPNVKKHLPSLTIQAGSEWSAAHIHDPVETSIAQLIDKYQKATGCFIGDVLHAEVHHWLYAKVTTAVTPNATICQNNVAVAGDWLSGARVEHAFTSGALAFRVLTRS